MMSGSDSQVFYVYVCVCVYLQLRTDGMPSQDAMNSLYDYFRTVFREVWRRRMPCVSQTSFHVIVLIVFVVYPYTCTDAHIHMDAAAVGTHILEPNTISLSLVK